MSAPTPPWQRASPDRRIVTLPDTAAVTDVVTVAAATGWSVAVGERVRGGVRLIFIRG